MKQRQSMGGVGLLILMLLVIMFFSLKVPGMATERELSYPEFMVYLENKTVESAQIRPNREVPTGEVVFETTSGDRIQCAGCEGSRDGAAQGGGSVHDHQRPPG